MRSLKLIVDDDSVGVQIDGGNIILIKNEPIYLSVIDDTRFAILSNVFSLGDDIKNGNTALTGTIEEIVDTISGIFAAAAGGGTITNLDDVSQGTTNLFVSAAMHAYITAQMQVNNT